MNKNDSLLYILNYYSLKGKSVKYVCPPCVVVFDKEDNEKLYYLGCDRHEEYLCEAYIYLAKILKGPNVNKSPGYMLCHK